MKIKIILAWLSLALISGCAASSTRCQIEGYLGPMEMVVRSQNQRITELRVLSHEDTAEIADPAFAEFIAWRWNIKPSTDRCRRRSDRILPGSLCRGIEQLLKRQGFTDVTNSLLLPPSLPTRPHAPGNAGQAGRTA